MGDDKRNRGWSILSAGDADAADGNDSDDTAPVAVPGVRTRPRDDTRPRVPAVVPAKRAADRNDTVATAIPDFSSDNTGDLPIVHEERTRLDAHSIAGSRRAGPQFEARTREDAPPAVPLGPAFDLGDGQRDARTEALNAVAVRPVVRATEAPSGPKITINRAPQAELHARKQRRRTPQPKLPTPPPHLEEDTEPPAPVLSMPPAAEATSTVPAPRTPTALRDLPASQKAKPRGETKFEPRHIVKPDERLVITLRELLGGSALIATILGAMLIDQSTRVRPAVQRVALPAASEVVQAPVRPRSWIDRMPTPTPQSIEEPAVVITPQASDAVGVLSIVSTPSGALVDIDGVTIGTTPLVTPAPNAQTIDVVLRLVGHDDYRTSMPRGEGGNFSLTAKLKKR